MYLCDYYTDGALCAFCSRLWTTGNGGWRQTEENISKVMRGGGSRVASFNITNLIAHLKSHKEVYEQFQDQLTEMFCYITIKQ